MALAVFSFILLLVIQLCLAGISFVSMRGLISRFSKPLESNREIISTLEEYMKQYRKVGARVDAQIPFIAKATDDFILLNKKAMYRIDLFSHLYLVYQLELTDLKQKRLRANTFLSSLFIIQILIFATPFIIELGSSISIIIIWIGILIQIVAIAYSIFKTRSLSILMNRVLERTETITELSYEELEMIEEIADSLRLRMLNYPIKSVQGVLRFILP